VPVAVGVREGVADTLWSELVTLGEALAEGEGAWLPEVLLLRLGTEVWFAEGVAAALQLADPDAAALGLRVGAAAVKTCVTGDQGEATSRTASTSSEAEVAPADAGGETQLHDSLECIQGATCVTAPGQRAEAAEELEFSGSREPRRGCVKLARPPENMPASHP